MLRRAVFLLAACLMPGCPKRDSPGAAIEVSGEPRVQLPESPPSAAAVAPRPDAEVELIGRWSSKVKASRHAAVAQLEPCVPVPVSPKRFGEFTLAPEARDGLFVEFFLPQGTTAHLCLYAFDEQGSVIGAATIPDTPRRFEGLGELMVGPYTVEVTPLPKER